MSVISGPASHVAALRIISKQMSEEGEHFHTDSYGIEALALSNAADLIEAQTEEITRLRAEVESLKEGNRDLLDWFDNLKADFDALRAENEKLRAVVNNLSDLAHKQIAENKRLRASLCADDQTLRLHLGEMTAQEMRTLRVGFKWAFRRAVLQETKP